MSQSTARRRYVEMTARKRGNPEIRYESAPAFLDQLEDWELAPTEIEYALRRRGLPMPTYWQAVCARHWRTR